MTDTCASCRYATNTEGNLLCRRYPPQVVVAGDDVVQGWPVVAPTWWCGEHQPCPEPTPPVPATPPIGATLPLQRAR